MKHFVLAGAMMLAGTTTMADAAPDPAAVLDTYANIAQATYEDALAGAQALDAAAHALVAEPGGATLAAARQARRESRVSYQQSEAFRFGNPAVDDWEGLVNAWPLDEGLIDYVDAGYGDTSDENPYYAANVVAHTELRIGGADIDASTIDAALLEQLQEIDGVESNVSRGYHAIEFLLWGQDLNGTGAGAGARPASDFDTANCTHGNCDRRAAYLTAATALLVADLEDAVAMWSQGGAARTDLTDGTAEEGLAMILTGLGSLSYGELAGERIQLGLMLHDPEEEHDCFSDNTAWSHYYDQVGMQNVLTGRYVRTDGSIVEGPSVADLVAHEDFDVAHATALAFANTDAAMMTMVRVSEAGKRYDQMLAEGDDAGNRVIQDVVDALKAQTTQIEQVVAALGLETLAIEGSDSLDDPDAVFQ
ncbi:MAG: peptidase [Proteobacteria bacterium]|nr:peptidase [Pseudomonadota bacterium]